MKAHDNLYESFTYKVEEWLFQSDITQSDLILFMQDVNNFLTDKLLELTKDE